MDRGKLSLLAFVALVLFPLTAEGNQETPLRKDVWARLGSKLHSSSKGAHILPAAAEKRLETLKRGRPEQGPSAHGVRTLIVRAEERQKWWGRKRACGRQPSNPDPFSYGGRSRPGQDIFESFSSSFSSEEEELAFLHHNRMRPFVNNQMRPFGTNRMRPFVNNRMHPFVNNRMHPFGTNRMHPFRNNRMHPFRTNRMHPFVNNRMHPFGNNRMHPFGNKPTRCCNYIPTFPSGLPFSMNPAPPQEISPSKFEGVICAGKHGQFQCSLGKKIKILSAVYGRQKENVCLSPEMYGTKQNTNCRRDVTKDLNIQCKDQEVCYVHVTNSKMGGDPCPHTNKYLSFTIQCVTQDSVTDLT